MGAILVTGGLGYIGSVLTRELVRCGRQVIVLDNGLVDHVPVPQPNISYVHGDVRDGLDWRTLLRDVDAVVHLAAIVGDKACEIDQDLAWQTNYLGLVNVAKACAQSGVRRLVFASTCSTYGTTAGKTVDESSPLEPLSLYAQSKVRAEEYLISQQAGTFLSPCILRLATVHGLSSRMRFDLAVNAMTATAALDQEISIFGGEQWRPFIHVRDVSRAILAALARPLGAPEIYNCGSDDENYRMIDVGRIIADEVDGTRLTIRPDLTDRRDYRVSFAKTQDLGFRTQYSLSNGIREMRDAVRSGLYNDFHDGSYGNEVMVRRFIERRDQALEPAGLTEQPSNGESIRDEVALVTGPA